VGEAVGSRARAQNRTHLEIMHLDGGGGGGGPEYPRLLFGDALLLGSQAPTSDAKREAEPTRGQER